MKSLMISISVYVVVFTIANLLRGIPWLWWDYCFIAVACSAYGRWEERTKP